jgi:lipoprotein-anchoring transpeptidase ErfK/SrfK
MIGQASSSGCFRMTNGHVVDLAKRRAVGAKVIVASRLPANVARSAF